MAESSPTQVGATPGISLRLTGLQLDPALLPFPVLGAQVLLGVGPQRETAIELLVPRTSRGDI